MNVKLQFFFKIYVSQMRKKNHWTKESQPKQVKTHITTAFVSSEYNFYKSSKPVFQSQQEKTKHQIKVVLFVI